MKYEDAVARLATLPEVLPPWSDRLRPVRLDGDTGMWHSTETPNDRMITGGTGRPASVLVLITPGDDGAANVILTERVARGGRPHSGEISFPGGVREPSDPDEIHTALREAQEEVGLDAQAAAVRVLGLLDTFTIPVSGFSVTPVLAIAERRPLLFPNPAEVARILEAPVRHFLPSAPVEMHERQQAEWTLRFGAYRVEEHVVWGATARILSQLGALIGD